MKKKKILIYLALFSVFLNMVLCPFTVRAFDNPFGGNGDPITNQEYKYWVDNLSYTLDRTQLTNKYLVDQMKNMQQSRNFYGGLVSVGSGSSVGNGFKNTIASNNSNSFNKMYLYNNQTTNNKTEYFSPMYVSNSGNTTNNYHWYNPVTTTYEVHNDWTYSPTYNTFNYTTNNYNYYVTNNNTYISYVIMPTPENTADDAESLYFEIYFELPDGRDSYDLTADEVWGTYFCYNAVNYDYVAEDDGTTLGLWHLNNNLKDSSYWANSTGKAYSSTYKDGGLSSGKYLGSTTSDYFTLPLDKVSFSPSSAWTLEWLEFTPSYNTGVTNVKRDAKHWNSSLGRYVCYTSQELYKSSPSSGIGISSVAWDGRFDDFAHYALVFDGSRYSIYVNGVEGNIFSHDPAYSGISISDSELKFFVSQFKSKDSSWVDSSETVTETKQSQIYLGDGKYTTKTWNETYIIDNHYTQTDYLIANRNSIIDEVRLSKGVIYKEGFEPPAQEFVTNMVFVLPESAQDGDFAIQSQYTVNGFRVGGVKPTYPSNGYVYVYEENDKVKSVQQYQGNGWYEVGASIYVDGAWKQADNYDLSTFKLSGDEESGGNTATAIKITRQPKDKKAHSGDTVTLSLKASGDGLTYKWQKSADGNTFENVGSDAPTLAVTVSSDDGFDYDNGKFRCVVTDSGGLVAFSDSVSITIVPDDEEIPPEEEPTDETDETKKPDDIDDTDYTGLFSGIKKIFKVFTGLFKTVIDGVSSLLSTALSFITNLTDATGQFGSFLSAMFPFIPKEIFSVITLGITILITVAVIKFIRG